MEINYRKVSDLIPYVNNTRTHSDEQVNQIASSIKEFGFTNPILIDADGGIIAGHGRVMAAKKLKMAEVPCIVLEDLTEAQKKAYIIADNKLALNAGWDEELLKLELENLKELDFDIDLIGFDAEELDNLLRKHEKDLQESDNPYTDKVEIPLYEIKGKKPELSEMINLEKYNRLLTEVNKSNIDDKIKDFLRFGATRHICFNYENIAEYYAHSDKETQELMENSAMVIVDFQKALREGFVKLSEELKEQYYDENK